MKLLFRTYLWSALRRLREPTRLEQLSREQEPAKFIDDVFLAAGRNLAVASGFLPAEMRDEGKVAFLCCRALDAHEDLNRCPEVAARRVAETADYLLGRCDSPPPPPDDPGRREADRLEFLIASRLPWLRQALASLPAERRDRISALIDDLARAMSTQDRSRFDEVSQSRYGEQVLGRVVRYCLDLMRVELPATADPGPIGRLCQAINDLRDFDDDAAGPREGADWDGEVEKAALWLELAEAATAVTAVMRALRFSKASGVRAAMTYMAATTLKAIARQANYPQPWLARHPVWGALLAESFSSAYERILLELDRTVLGILVHRAQSLEEADPSRAALGLRLPGCRQDAFELTLADQHPDPRSASLLKRACRLLKYSILLTSYLPQAPLSRCPSGNADGQLLMISDYFMAKSLTVIRGAGLSVLGAFSRTCATLSEELHQWREPNDHRGHLAAFLTEVVGSARGQSRAQLEGLCARNRDASRELHLRDQRPSVLHKVKTHLFGEHA